MGVGRIGHGAGFLDRRIDELRRIGQILTRQIVTGKILTGKISAGPWRVAGRSGRGGMPAKQLDELADFVKGGGRIEDHGNTSYSPFVRQEYQALSRFGSNLELWILPRI